MEFINFLTAVLPAVLALATVILAFFTFFLWHETKKSREFQQELYQPDVGIIEIYVGTVGNSDAICFDIINIGKARAYNIEIKENKNPTKPPILKATPVSKLYSLDPSKYAILFLKTIEKNSQSIMKDIPKEKLSLTITYQNKKNKKFEDKFDIYTSRLRVNENYTEKIAEELKATNKILKDHSRIFKEEKCLENTYCNLSLEEIKNCLKNLGNLEDGVCLFQHYHKDIKCLLDSYRAKLLAKKDLNDDEKAMLNKLQGNFVFTKPEELKNFISPLT